MFFKRKIFVPIAWVETVNRKRELYARRIADFLERKAAKVPPARMRVYVVVFLCLMAMADLAITVGAMRGKSANSMPPFGNLERVVLPRARRPAPRDGLGCWLDSIRHTADGGRELDSLLRARPGLMDSLRRVEGMEW